MRNKTRRDVIKGAAAIPAFMFLPSCQVYGPKTPSEQFRFVQVGCGGKGRVDMDSTKACGGKLVAMAEIDSSRAKVAQQRNPGVPMYSDYRKMLDKHHKH